MNHPEQFIESKHEHSWLGYLERMSCQVKWAVAIIIKAVSSCLYLSIHIAELNPIFSPVTVVEPVNVTNALNINIGHLDEFHYVAIVENRTMEIRDNSKQTKNAVENKPVDDSEKRKAYRRKYMKEYMKDKRADYNFRINQNQTRVEGCNINSKTSRNKRHQAAKRRKLNPEHVLKLSRAPSENEKQESPQHITKQSARKRQKGEALARGSQLTCSSHELQPAVDKTRNIEHSGTSRNIPEHQIIITILRKICKINFFKN